MHEISKPIFRHCLETICMKCQSLYSGKNKKKLIYLLSAEFDHKMVKLNVQIKNKKINFIKFVYVSMLKIV